VEAVATLSKGGLLVLVALVVVALALNLQMLVQQVQQIEVVAVVAVATLLMLLVVLAAAVSSSCVTQIQEQLHLVQDLQVQSHLLRVDTNERQLLLVAEM